jgi:hypothetical protein
MPLPVMLSVTVPLNENVVAVVVGVGDGEVVVLLPPHADAEIRRKTMQPRVNVARVIVGPSPCSA